MNEKLDKKITETNTKINEVKSDLHGEIKKVDDKLNNLSIKVPFQFKVASIIATDQVEILGTTIKVSQLLWNYMKKYKVL